MLTGLIMCALQISQGSVYVHTLNLTCLQALLAIMFSQDGLQCASTMCPPSNITGKVMLPHVPAVYSHRLLVCSPAAAHRAGVQRGGAAARAGGRAPAPPALPAPGSIRGCARAGRRVRFGGPPACARSAARAGAAVPLRPEVCRRVCVRQQSHAWSEGLHLMHVDPSGQVMYVHSRQTALYVKSRHVIIRDYRLALC